MSEIGHKAVNAADNTLLNKKDSECYCTRCNKPMLALGNKLCRTCLNKTKTKTLSHKVAGTNEFISRIMNFVVKFQPRIVPITTEDGVQGFRTNNVEVIMTRTGVVRIFDITEKKTEAGETHVDKAGCVGAAVSRIQNIYDTRGIRRIE